jgi:quercetin dioxygenase-like cupin family protein
MPLISRNLPSPQKSRTKSTEFSLRAEATVGIAGVGRKRRCLQNVRLAQEELLLSAPLYTLDMALNGVTSHAIEQLDAPPGTPNKAYVLPSLCGEIIYIPCSKSAMRLLVTGKETKNAFAVVGTGGTASAPIGFHFHRETHDVFLCLKGRLNVWAGEKCRTMGPGDFASVPPV